MPTPSTNEREQAIHAALTTAHKNGAPPERDNNPTANLVTLSYDIADLCWSIRGGYPLDQLDLNINTDERIKRLIEALGQAAPYWLHSDNTTQTEIAYREETIAMVAYQAACTIVANSRGLI